MFVIFTMALNESKFLGYAIRSWLASGLVQAAVVVEGAVESMADFATKEGHSTDGTWDLLQKLKGEYQDRLYIERAGFVPDKKDLQNAGLEIIHTQLRRKPKWVIIAGADELYTVDGLKILAKHARKTEANVLLYPFNHFWRRPDLVATGSSWSMWMHRCYRYFPNLKFRTHNSPPVPSGRTERVNDGVQVFHYVGMQDAESITSKLALYQRRDGGRLKVRDTWTNWKWGDQTQWTHDGGSVKRFDGEHPDVIASAVWDMIPKSDGKPMRLPWVPWEMEMVKRVMICVDKDFVDDKDYQRIAKMVLKSIKNTTLVTLDKNVVGFEFEGVEVGLFSPVTFLKVDLNLCLGYPYLGGTRKRNVLLTKKKIANGTAVGFVVGKPSSVETYEQLIELMRDDVPLYKPIVPKGVIPTKKQIIDSPRQMSLSGHGGVLKTRQTFTLHNTTQEDITNKDMIICSWLSMAGKPIEHAAKTSQPATPCKVGEIVQVSVPVPKPPLTVGSLILDISLFSGQKPLAGLGARVRMDFRGR